MCFEQDQTRVVVGPVRKADRGTGSTPTFPERCLVTGCPFTNGKRRAADLAAGRPQLAAGPDLESCGWKL